jgi:hypothetical protein
MARISIQNGTFASTRPAGLRRNARALLAGRAGARAVVSAAVLILR